MGQLTRGELEGSTVYPEVEVTTNDYQPLATSNAPEVGFAVALARIALVLLLLPVALARWALRARRFRG